MAAGNNVIINETQCIEDLTTFIWKIKDFSVCPLSFLKPVNSGVFPYNNIKFTLRASFESSELSNQSYNLVVYIDYTGLNDKDLICKVFPGFVYKGTKYAKRIELINGIQTGHAYLFPIEKNELIYNSFISDDCLTIVCEVMTSCCKQDLRGEETTLAPRIDYLSRDFGRLIDSSVRSDVSIIVEDQQIPVHSLILVARSPVFAAMLTHNMKEHNDAKIKITDFSATLIKYFLRYLYTGEVPEIENLSQKMLLELYSAADKYQVMELKDLCASIIAKNLSVDNIENCAVLAFQHNDHKIMDSVIKSFAQNRKLVGSESWQNLVKIIPALPEQVLSEIVKN